MMVDYVANTIPQAVLVISLLAAVQFAVGVLVGVLISRSQGGGIPKSEPLGQTCRVIEGFCQTAETISKDLSEYQRRLMDTERELRPISETSGTLDAESVRRVVADMVAANDELRHRLENAETKIRDTIQSLESQAREARTDSLTQLANRGALDDELKRRLAECQRSGAALGVLLVDVDHFKRFNDTHGHLAGDEVLRQLASCLRACTREMDLVARFGGEEFAVVLPGTNLSEAIIVARRMLESVRKLKIRFEGQTLTTTVSLGVAQVVAGEAADSIIGRADTALYAAKRDGRDRGFQHDGRECGSIDGDEFKDPEVVLMELCDDLRRKTASLTSVID